MMWLHWGSIRTTLSTSRFKGMAIAQSARETMVRLLDFALSVRMSSAWVLVALASSIDAQVPVDDYLILTHDAVSPQPLFHFEPAAGTLKPVSGAPPEISHKARTMEIDPTTGDVIVGVNELTPGEGPTLWRLRLSTTPLETTVSHAELLVSLGAHYEVVDSHREPSGCMLFLLQNLTNPDGQHFDVLRVAVSSDGFWISSRIPFEGARATDEFYSITSDAEGNVHIGFFRLPPHASGVGGIYKGAPGGGVLEELPGWNKVVPWAMAFDAAGNLAHCGLRNPFWEDCPNFSWCGSTHVIPTLGPCGGGYPIYWPVDILLDSTGTSFLAATLDPCAHPSGGGSALWQVSAEGCTPGTAVLLAIVPNLVFKVAQRTAEQGHGCGCTTSTGTLPRIVETAAPVASGQWVVSIEDGAPNAPSFLTMGLSNTDWWGVPLPSEAFSTAPGCLLLTSFDSYVGFVVLDGNGAGSITTRVPPGVAGWTIYSQWILRDLLNNDLGISVSAGMESLIR